MVKKYYKYRPLYKVGVNGTRVPDPFTESVFRKAEIYYCTPEDFNDPFDCNLRLHADDSTDQQWEEYLDKAFKSKCTVEQLNSFKSQKAWQTTPGFKRKIGLTTQRDHYKKSSVFCLSKKANSIPMFSYYADSHRGIAIEFSFSDGNIPCGIHLGDPRNPYDRRVVFSDVDYSQNLPELNYHKLYGTPQLVKSLLFTKYAEWEHEQEFRIVRRNVSASPVSFDKNLVTMVIFGCKTKDEDFNLVKTWLTGWPSDVIFSKAEAPSNEFSLNIKKFDTIRSQPVRK